MNEAYINSRLYWNTTKNFNKPGVKTFAEDSIIAAGFEFVLFDSTGIPRKIFIGANSSWESVMFYENNTRKGINTIYGANEQIFKIII